MSSPPDMISQSLIDELRRETRAECLGIEEAARREAQSIVAAAFVAARARGREAIAAMRHGARRRLRLAEAQRQTRERAEQQARRAAALRRARPLLESAMRRRWQEVSARRLWIAAAARCATARLRPGAWTVQHPARFDEDDKRHMLDVLRENAEANIAFAVNADLIAGIRVLAAGAVLDASLPALLGDDRMIEAMLLAELAQASDETRKPVGGAP